MKDLELLQKIEKTQIQDLKQNSTPRDTKISQGQGEQSEEKRQGSKVAVEKQPQEQEQKQPEDGGWGFLPHIVVGAALLVAGASIMMNKVKK